MLTDYPLPTRPSNDSVGEQHRPFSDVKLVTAVSDHVHLPSLVERHFQGAALPLPYDLFLRLATMESNSGFK